ncbi:hypothetical protein CcI156_04350 [Frankia sp. CcI156]|jgi:hypothetical protein|uniref:Uncharacterized protein n=1 Tax=Frankia casuarinae (strain DSM 45818 / CECT 9043 / HFP020203 / CcI3) TaxID=106370 RepID=Q2JCB4_FRACC|nr:MULTISPECIES: hypothetical protein [Frankia]ABD11078.1 hypothetical protein Francci3_1702 [Frankia casuarinae]ESZ99995.1 hypothetical protein CcI6DRAFT_04601 [Frankia sp. CcI6]EYT90689.1 hypothetical protein ThrDRAFT_03685 [Frankia casuarinae]OAA19748.1 hypothetical protein AAY23_11022 [Frankia casuarinae]OFB39722.1 hypothetical protein Manayef4_20145 [Frankia sp. CgIM4]
MPSTPHLIGFAELLGRLRHVLTVNGEDTVTLRFSGLSYHPYFDRDGWPRRLLAHVLFGLDGHLDPASLLNLEPAASLLGALGYPLTAKAAALANEAEQLTMQGWTWGHAVDTTIQRTDVDDEPEDTRIGDVAVMAVLSHIAARHATEMTSPIRAVPLFHRGYPTGLLGHLAACLRLDAVHASALGDSSALALFGHLGWTLSPRASAVLTTAEQAEAAGATWTDVVIQARATRRDHLRRDPWDR